MSNMEYVVNTADNVFTRIELEQIFTACEGKTLGFLDRMNVFARAIVNPKITGIAGDVVEQSILGMKANSRQMPDLLVDGVEIELKTTGVRTDKKNESEYDAKEPVSITAVSIDKIVKEDDFDKSLLWHKLNRILFVYYHYSSNTIVKALGYSEFKILSYQFYEPSALDKARFQSDWLIVRNFLRNVQETYSDPTEGYPLLSTNINPELVVLDTAPKYPHPPRFRIKRAYFTLIVKKHFESKSLEMLDDEFTSYKELDNKLHMFREKFGNKKVSELVSGFNIQCRAITKQISEQIIVRMFGGNSKKLNKVELFEAFGIIGFSIAISAKDGRTEDTKMCPIDFEEIMEEKPFEESDVYKYYHDNAFLFFILKETDVASSAKGKEQKVKFENNEFLGFKRIRFDDDFIFTHVKPVWERIRELIDTKTLKEEYKKGSTTAKAPNFPKSSEGVIFVRGTGTDISDKPVCVNGIRMYRQNFWIRGSELVDMLNEKDYI